MTEMTRSMTHALAAELDGESVERWNSTAGEPAVDALHNLGLIRRGRADRSEWTGCLYLTEAGTRAADIARTNPGGYRPGSPDEYSEEAFTVVASRIRQVVEEWRASPPVEGGREDFTAVTMLDGTVGRLATGDLNALAAYIKEREGNAIGSDHIGQRAGWAHHLNRKEGN